MRTSDNDAATAAPGPAAAAARIDLPATPAVPVADAALPALFQGSLRPLAPAYRAVDLWSSADGLRMSAAMSFYGMFSVAPLLLLLVALLGYVVDRNVVESSLIEQVQSLVGAKGAEVVQAAIASAQQPGDGLLASLLAFGLLVVGATGVFAELQSALERLWTQGTGTQAVDAWWHKATLRLRGVAYVLALGFLMLVSLVIASAVNLLQHWAGAHYQAEALWGVLNHAISLVITTGLFVALMRMSAGPQPRLRHLVVGAAIAAVLFSVGKYALALYLSTAAVVSAYGAAGSLVVLLMWIYFASAVLLFGASCARVLAERHGEFTASATPPPAAAACALQGEARHAGADDDAVDSTAAVAAVLSDLTDAPGSRAAQAQRPAQSVRPTAALGEALGGVIQNVRGKDLAGAAVVFAASYFLLRPRGGSRAAAPAPSGAWWHAARAPKRWPGPPAGRSADGFTPDGDGRADDVPPPPTPHGLRGLGLALLGSGAARQGARWLWQGTRAARSDAIARMATGRGGAFGGATQFIARANAWRERHALAQARRELDDDLSALRRAARRRR